VGGQGAEEAAVGLEGLDVVGDGGDDAHPVGAAQLEGERVLEAGGDGVDVGEDDQSLGGGGEEGFDAGERLGGGVEDDEGAGGEGAGAVEEAEQLGGEHAGGGLDEGVAPGEGELGELGAQEGEGAAGQEQLQFLGDVVAGAIAGGGGGLAGGAQFLGAVDGALEHELEVVEADGLLDELEGAELHALGLHGRGGLAAEECEDGARVQLLDLGGEGEAVHSRHVHVGEEDLMLAAGELFEGLGTAGPG
jgi:hypothetical protein